MKKVAQQTPQLCGFNELQAETRLHCYAGRFHGLAKEPPGDQLPGIRRDNDDAVYGKQFKDVAVTTVALVDERR